MYKKGVLILCFGFMSVGAGYSWLHSKCQSSLLFGFSPALISGKNILILGFKNSIIPIDLGIGKNIKLSPYTGFSVTFSGSLPLPLLPHLGIRVFKPLSKKIKGFDFYAETTTTNRELNYFFKNNTIKLYSVLNIALGTTFYIK